MVYSVLILKRAQRQLSRLSRAMYPRVRDSIRDLATTPRPHGCMKLTDREGWRIRVGPVRVVYEINDETRSVTILDIGPRATIYR